MSALPLRGLRLGLVLGGEMAGDYSLSQKMICSDYVQSNAFLFYIYVNLNIYIFVI